MRIQIQMRPAEWNVGDKKFLELFSVWNSSTTVRMEFEGTCIEVNGEHLIESIKRIIHRPYGTTD